MHESAGDQAPPRPRRPLGVTVVALFYIVLGSHALMFGAYLATLTPASAPTVPFAALLARDPGLVRAYGLALAGIAVPFFVDGAALYRQRWWARWLTPGLAPLHIVGPPFLLGGIVFALLVNVYLFGSGAAQAWLARPSPGLASQP